MRAIFFEPVGVRTPVDSPTYFGLSSQPEEETTIGFSESLLSASGLDTGDLSEITRGGLGEADIGGFASIRGGGMPVWLWKGASEIFLPRIFGAGGPASSGVLNAFSHDPGFGSTGGEAIAAEKLGDGRPGTETLDVDGVLIEGIFSTLSSATCASSTRLRFIRFSSICSALSNRIPGRSPRWNLKAKVIANAAKITRTAISTVVKASCGNFVSCSPSPALTEGLLA